MFHTFFSHLLDCLVFKFEFFFYSAPLMLLFGVVESGKVKDRYETQVICLRTLSRKRLTLLGNVSHTQKIRFSGSNTEGLFLTACR